MLSEVFVWEGVPADEPPVSDQEVAAAHAEMLAKTRRLKRTSETVALITHIFDAELDPRAYASEDHAAARRVLTRIVELEGAIRRDLFREARGCRAFLSHGHVLAADSLHPLTLHFEFRQSALPGFYDAWEALTRSLERRCVALGGGAWALGHASEHHTVAVASRFAENFVGVHARVADWLVAPHRRGPGYLSDVALRARSVLTNAEALMLLHWHAVHQFVGEVHTFLLAPDDASQWVPVDGDALRAGGVIPPTVRAGDVHETAMAIAVHEHGHTRVHSVRLRGERPLADRLVVVSVPFATFSTMVDTVYSRGGLVRDAAGGVRWDMDPQVLSTLHFLEQLDGWIVECAAHTDHVPINIITFV